MHFEWKSYLDQVLVWLASSGLRIVLIVIIALIALRLSRFLARRILAPFRREGAGAETLKRTDTLSALIRYIFTFSILGVAMVMILGEFGIQIGPILAAAGIAGVAIGFGSQQLVQDVISGFFILLEDQIRVGDVVQIAGKSGLVEGVNLRMIVLRDLEGNVHYVRNGHIDVVTNMTKEYSRYVFNIGVAYREDVDEVMDLLREIDAELREDPEFKDDIIEPLEVLGLDQFADSAIVIKARTTTKPIKQWRVGREFNRRLKRKFDDRGIEIPFPHLTLYAGQDKNGDAPPLNVLMREANRAAAGDAG